MGCLIKKLGRNIPTCSFWGLSFWGAAFWSGSTMTNREWVQGMGMGVAASITLAGSSDDEVTWISTDFSYKSGGLL